MIRKVVISRLRESQSDLIARLTGHTPYGGETRLSSRGSAAERVAAADLLVDELERRGLPAQQRTYRFPNHYVALDLILSPYRGANIVSLIPSTTGGEEYVVLGAHYDSMPGCPGAVDNATGIALVLAVADALIDLETRHRNFLIVLFDQEEEENIGSRAFVRAFTSEALTLHSAHTVDMVGWDADGDRAVEIERPTPELDAVYRRLGRARSIPVTATTVDSSDHKSFRDAGYPAVGITCELVSGDRPPHKDTPEDTFETVNFDFLESTTLLVIDVMTHLAETP